ncbi:AMP-binding protein, partial [bacterium]|nr:AMP-binding protein [bacterium]
MQLLHQAIENWAVERPHAPAVSRNQQRHGWLEMNEAVCRFRGALAARDIGKGDHVAILLPNCPHFVIAYYAVLGLGAVAVPINIQHKSREIGWQVESAEVKAVIGWSKFRAEAEKAVAHLESVSHRVYLGDEIPEGTESMTELLGTSQPLVSDPSIQESDIAVLLYTAGTSGKPRGIELSHGNLAAQTFELGKLLRIRSEDSMLAVLPFTGIMGLSTALHLPMYHGAALSIHSRFHAGDVLDTLAEEKISLFAGNPFMYALMATFPSADKLSFDNLRHLICCESKLSPETARIITAKMKVPVCEGYGATETSGIIAYNVFPGLTEDGSVGQPIGNTEITIFDDHDRIALPGATGRVAVRGPSVMQGYRHRPDRTAQVMLKDGWLLTDDIGVMDGDSNLIVTGHLGDVIHKGGFPVHPREVEEVIEGLPHVDKVAVISMPDSVYGEEIKAFVVLKEGASISPSEIIEYVK